MLLQLSQMRWKIAKARITAQQLEQMNEDLKKDNLRSLQSITDVSPSTSQVNA